jgi:hypothetical protein
MNNPVFKRLVFHPQFKETLTAVKNISLSQPTLTGNIKHSVDDKSSNLGSVVFSNIDGLRKIKLDPQKGFDLVIRYTDKLLAYDESLNMFSSLEGKAYATSHSLVLLGKEEYLPANYLTFYFYTKSSDIVSRSEFIKYSDKPEYDSKKDYMRDRMEFLLDYSIEGSILLIDGPLIAGDAYTSMIKPLKQLVEKNISVVFFVKNSSSNMVTDSTLELKGKFNSDLHWCYQFLNPGERTGFFHYMDEHNPDNAKVFCYLKSFASSPQRIEFYGRQFFKSPELMADITNLIHYMILAQGSTHNPQVRLIAIAEEYARQTLKAINFNQLTKSLNITPTINQERFGWD